MSNTEKILVIKLGALGDFLQASGPMKAIRAHHPGAKITLLTTKPYKALAEKSGYVDEIWIDERPKWFEFGKVWAFRGKLNKVGFARVYDLQNNDRTSGYFHLMSPKPEWVGVALGVSHRNADESRTAGHALDGHIQTLAKAGLKDVTLDTLEWLDDDASEFKPEGNYALIVPGCSAENPGKRWPAEGYGAFCKKLAERGLTPLILGTKPEIDIGEDIRKLCPEAKNLCGLTSLGHIAALARQAKGACGNDTGPVHLIAATGCPTLALFSANSNLKKHTPKGAQVETLYEAELKDLSAETTYKRFTQLAGLRR